MSIGNLEKWQDITQERFVWFRVLKSGVCMLENTIDLTVQAMKCTVTFYLSKEIFVGQNPYRPAVALL